MRTATPVTRALALLTLCVPLALAGCSGGGSSASGHFVPVAATAGGSANTPSAPSIYAFEPGQIEIIPATANGNVTPAAVFAYPSHSVCLFGALDAAFNAYLACPTINGQPGSVKIFSTINGPQPAVRTIIGPHTGIQFATGVAVGGPNGAIYVLQEAPFNGHDATEILVFDKNASGDTAPKRQILAADFPAEEPCLATNAFDIAVDPTGNVYITIQPGGGVFIYKYAPDAEGNAPPIAAIRNDFQMFGLALDGPGNVYTTSANRVLEFAAGSTGAATPIRVIGGANTGFEGLRSVTLDAAGEIFVGGSAGLRAKISVFAASATGDTAPIRTIGGPALLHDVPNSLVVQ